MYFGYNPHLCFKATRFHKRVDKDGGGGSCRKSDTYGIGESGIMQPLQESRSGDHDVSQQALDPLLKDYETRQAAAFYDYISETSDAASLWGHVFERQVLNHSEERVARAGLPLTPGLRTPLTPRYSSLSPPQPRLAVPPAARSSVSRSEKYISNPDRSTDQYNCSPSTFRHALRSHLFLLLVESVKAWGIGVLIISYLTRRSIYSHFCNTSS